MHWVCILMSLKGSLIVKGMSRLGLLWALWYDISLLPPGREKIFIFLAAYKAAKIILHTTLYH